MLNPINALTLLADCYILHPRTLNPTVFSPRPHKVEITGGIVVGKVPTKLGNTSLVVVSMLRVKFYMAVTVQKHQLHREE